MPYAVGTMVENSINSAGPETQIDAPNFTAVAGDLLICAIAVYGTATTVSISATVGSNGTWTRAGSGYQDGSNQMEVFYLANAAAGSSTIRASFSGGGRGYPCIAIIPVTGIATAAPFLDVVFNYQLAPGTGTDAITSTNLAALSTQPALMFGLSTNINASGNAVPNTGTGYTSIGTGWSYGGAFSISMRAEHKRVTVTTADKTTFTAQDATSGGHKYMTTAVAFIEATGFVSRLSLLGAG